MAIYSSTYRYLFLMAPRTACSAVGKVLREELDGVRLPDGHIRDASDKVLVGWKHCTLGQLKQHGVLSDAEAASLLTFCTVRNPFDSLVTLYETMRTRFLRKLESEPNSFVHRKPGFADLVMLATEVPFAEWVERRFVERRFGVLIRWAPPKHMYGRYIRDADVIMRYERLQDDFRDVLRHIGVTHDVEIPHFNVSEKASDDYRDYYTRRTREIVEHVFRPDLERFGYAF